MIKLLDTHLHLIYRNECNYEWTKGIPPLAENAFSLEDYKELTNSLEVGGCLFMEADADDFKKETKFIKNLSDDFNSGIKGLIVSIRPEKDEDFDSWLNESIDMGVVGFRRILHVAPDDMSQSQTFRNNINKIGSSGKVFEMCFLQKQLPVAIELAKSCDNTTMVLNHCGVPDIVGDGLKVWSDHIESLSKIENVNCKLSGLMAYCAPGTSSYETIEPYVDHVLNTFGPKRIVWGSDWPVVNLGKGLEEWISVTRKILDKLSPDESKLIAHANAEKIYKVSL